MALLEGLESRVLLSAELFNSAAALSSAGDVVAVASVGDQAIFAGREYDDANGNQIVSKTVDIYNAATDQWSVAALSQARQFITVATVGTTALFAGGVVPGSFGNDSAVSNAVDIYNSATGVWSTAQLAQARWDMAEATVGDEVLFAGGFSDDSAASVESDVVDIYNGGTGRWSTATLSEAGLPEATVVGNDVIFAQGNVADVYDAITGAWSTATLSSPREAPSGVSVDDQAILAGGIDYDLFYQPSAAVDIYNAGTGQWSTATLSAARDDMGQTAVGDLALFAGGATSNNFDTPQTPDSTTAAVDIYDAATDSWSTATLSQSREAITAVTVDGQAIFAGGTSAGAASSAVDIYDSNTNSWSTATLSQARYDIAVVTLGNQVIFAGGNNGNGGWSNAVDIYDASTGHWSTATLAQPGPFEAVGAVNGQAVFLGQSAGAGLPGEATIFSSSSIAQPASPSVVPGGALAAAPSSLSWAASAGATSYNVYLDDVLVQSGAATTYTPSTPIADGSHTWQIVAENGGTFTAGPRWQFTVGAPAMSADPDPANGEDVPDGLTALTWAPTPGATNYDVYLDGSLVENVVANQLMLADPLSAGAHTWQVIAHNDYAATAGPVWRFTTPSTHLTLNTTPTLSQARQLLTAATVGDKVLFAGGYGDFVGASQVVDIYDSSTGEWSTSQLPEGGEGMTAVTVGDQVFFAGGTSSGVQIYNADTGLWSTMRLPDSARGAAMTAVGGDVIFAGGMAPVLNTKDLRAVDIYNVRTGRWSTARLSVARNDITAITVGDLAIFAGGDVPDQETTSPSAAVDIYNFATGRWSHTQLSQARDDFAVTAVGDQVIFAGGVTGAYEPSDGVDIYNMAKGTWSTTHLSQARYDISVTTVGGVAIFAGGEIVSNAECDAVDIYNSVTGVWSTATLPVERARSAAITMGDLAIFAGGANSANYSNAVDIYDAGTGQWSLATLAQPVEWLAGAKLGNQAIFAGGFGGSSSDDPFGGPVNAVNIFTDTAPTASLDASMTHPSRNRVSVTLTNTGDAPLASPFTVAIYGSTSRTLGSDAVLLGRMHVSAPLAAGASVTVTVPLSLAKGIVPGSYHLFALVGPPHDLVAVASSRRHTFSLGPAAGAGLTSDASAFSVADEWLETFQDKTGVDRVD